MTASALCRLSVPLALVFLAVPIAVRAERPRVAPAVELPPEASSAQAVAVVPAPLNPPPRPPTRLSYRSTTALRYNGLGLITDNQLMLRRELYQHQSPALRDNFVGMGLSLQASPAFARVGGVVEFQPLSIMRLWGQFEAVKYFGSFRLMQSFDSPNADFSDTQLSALADLPEPNDARNYSTTGTQAAVGMDLQVKVRRVAARTLTRLVRGNYQLRDGDTVYYDQTYDVLAPNRGLFLANDTDVLYVSDRKWVAGLRATTTQTFYDEQAYTAAERAAGQTDNLNGPTLRVGPIVTYSFFDTEGAIYNKPTIVFIAQWWAKHRYRTGEDSSSLLPCLTVAFQFTGDLLPWR